MDDFLYYTNLYDVYKDLLTDMQRKYFEDYYFSNLSYGEISQNNNISRSGVFRQINLTIKKLEKFENTLHILEKNKILEEIINNEKDKIIKEELKKIINM